MSDKKYYWLKLKCDFFKRHDMQIIEAMPNGKDYVLFYLKLLVESVDHDGALRFSDTIPYNEQMLATITGTNIDVVRSAMKILTELRMIEVMDDQTVYMIEVQKMVGCETSVAERVRKCRERKDTKALHGNTVALQGNTSVENCNIEIELEKEIELELEKDNTPIGVKSTGTSRFTPPNVDQVREYCRERANRVDPEKFFDHYSANGWVRGKTKIKDWQACVRTWEKNEAPAQARAAPRTKVVVEQQYEQREYDPAKYSGLTAEEISEVAKYDTNG